MLKYKIIEKLKTLYPIILKYWLLLFYIASIVYLELVYRLWNFRNMSADYLFAVLFSLSAGTILYLFSSIINTKINKIITIVLTLLLVLFYSVQLVYFNIFHTPLSLYSFMSGEDALQFSDIIVSAITHNIAAVILLFVPVILLIMLRKKLNFDSIKRPALYFVLLFFAASYIISILSVNLTGEKPMSQHQLYYESQTPEISVMKLGLMTTMRLDFETLIFGFGQSAKAMEVSGSAIYTGSNNVVTNKTTTEAAITTQQAIEYNVMNIDFKKLIAMEKDQNLVNMHKYFSSITPTRKNKFTGLFKGDNLILITAESFSPYAIDPKLTPTLYKMSREGFVFKNFYNPVWGVSTSDGEYVACTGLIPKPGVWSFAKSGKNYLPFVMGNQFKKLGYPTRAYHDHTYTYYKRNISHPNMGYVYKGVGNGLKLKKTWPESDVEMIDVTAKEFIGKKPFHTYYMTVSGHMNYSFSGNYIDNKNKKLVQKLPYSEPSRAYIAGNLELEFAIKDLISKLEAAGIADKTVIAISPDHYPYGLPRECIDELAGHKVENNFELYRSSFILWKKGMKPVTVEKPCSSLDINPTISNLFGLKYDSRLLMGSDILSNSPPLVIFSNHSWITDRAMYNAVTNKVTYKGTRKPNADYVNKINKIVENKFIYSAKILETDYYKRVFKVK